MKVCTPLTSFCLPYYVLKLELELMEVCAITGSRRECNAKLQTVDYILTAGVSKACAATATYPLQVLRSRLQVLL